MIPDSRVNHPESIATDLAARLDAERERKKRDDAVNAAEREKSRRRAAEREAVSKALWEDIFALTRETPSEKVVEIIARCLEFTSVSMGVGSEWAHIAKRVGACEDAIKEIAEKIAGSAAETAQ